MTLSETVLSLLREGDWGVREAICHARLACARQAQPLAELERKAHKAARRQRIWTQEELDFIRAEAATLWPLWNGEV